LRELELMHHWSTHTYTSAGREWDKLFKEYIPKEALRADYLMSALLGLTSFHLASDALAYDLPLARLYVQAGLGYQDRGLSGLRIALGNITADNCSPVLFASILISACVIISPLLPAGTDDSTQSAAEALLPLSEYLNAVDAIKVASQHWLTKTSIGMYLDKNFEDVAVERPLFVGELRRLNETMTAAPHKRVVFEKAIDVLEKASYKEAPISQWLVDAGADFLHELRQRESMALAIYMHWGTLLDQLHGIWWARFSGRRLVEELSLSLPKSGEWTHIINWCRAQVGLQTDDENPIPEQF
jgi:hypothetical protein